MRYTNTNMPNSMTYQVLFLLYKCKPVRSGNVFFSLAQNIVASEVNGSRKKYPN